MARWNRPFAPGDTQLAAAAPPPADWQLGFGVRREDIKIETILIAVGGPRERTQCRHLGAGRPEFVGFAYGLPLRHRLRRSPAQITNRRLGVGDTQKLRDAAFDKA